MQKGHHDLLNNDSSGKGVVSPHTTFHDWRPQVCNTQIQMSHQQLNYTTVINLLNSKMRSLCPILLCPV